jgi:hypothetical protein
MKQARTATIDKRNGISITEPGDSTGGRSSPHAGYDDLKLERCLAMKSNPLVLHSGVMLLAGSSHFRWLVPPPLMSHRRRVPGRSMKLS